MKNKPIDTNDDEKLPPMRTTAVFGQCNSALIAPLVSFDAVTDSAGDVSKNRLPFRLTSCDTTQGKFFGVAFIKRLFLLCSPFHITDFVMSIGVNTIQCVCWGWALADMVNKFLKGVKAKLDTSAAIIHIFVIIRILATGLGTSIRSVLDGVRQAVDSALPGSSLSTPTSATFTVAGSNISKNDRPFRATITTTKSFSWHIFPSRNQRKNSPPIISFAYLG